MTFLVSTSMSFLRAVSGLLAFHNSLNRSQLPGLLGFAYQLRFAFEGACGSCRGLQVEVLGCCPNECYNTPETLHTFDSEPRVFHSCRAHTHTHFYNCDFSCRTHVLHTCMGALDPFSSRDSPIGVPFPLEANPELRNDYSLRAIDLAARP